MTTPTTGTAPLIERIRNQINYLDAVVEYDVRDNAEMRQGIADLRSLLNDAFTGPGIWIEREQARETIVKRLRSHWFGALPSSPCTDAERLADIAIAALAGEERP
jgi:hypothetical protein